jgi:coenzyme F420-reducing hydrogenase alpha subunit
MKITELKKLIKEAVREEIRTVLREELKDVKFLVDVLTEAKKPSQSIQEFKQYAPITPKSNKEFNFGVKNNALNDLLKETAASFTNEEYKTVIGANSSMAPNFSNFNQNSSPNLAPSTDVNGNIAHITPELDQVFSRNYSALMDKLL